MSDELEILTTNAAADGWIDNIPGAVSTGYQAQNTNIAARSLGQDLTYLRVSDDEIGVTLEVSGPVDDGGVPFKLAAQTTLYPTSNGTWYVAITAGSGALNRSVELIQGTPAYDSIEGVLKVGVYRILNWTITQSPLYTAVSPIAQTGALGGAFPLQSPGGYIRYRDYPYLWWGGIFDRLSTPAAQPSGVAFDGTNLISSDQGADLIYIHDGINASILSSFSTANPTFQIQALTFDGTNLISCDTSDTIYIHDGISASILTSFSSPSSLLSGIAYDGTNLISSDQETGLIYIHSGISATILSSFSVPGSGAAPDRLAFDGTNLLSYDQVDDLLYVHNGTKANTVYSFDLNPAGAVTGVTYDGNNLISLDGLSDNVVISGLTF